MFSVGFDGEGSRKGQGALTSNVCLQSPSLLPGTDARPALTAPRNTDGSGHFSLQSPRLFFGLKFAQIFRSYTSVWSLCIYLELNNLLLKPSDGDVYDVSQLVPRFLGLK